MRGNLNITNTIITLLRKRDDIKRMICVFIEEGTHSKQNIEVTKGVLGEAV